MKMSALQLCFFWLLAATWGANKSVEALTFYNVTRFWPMRMQKDGIYAIPYQRAGPPEDAMTRFQWALNYISRGSNIEFIMTREFGKRGLIILPVTDSKYATPFCYSENFRTMDFPVNVYISNKCSTATFIEMIVKALGFQSDGYRSDRGGTITFSAALAPVYPVYDNLVTSTPYDALSVLHPRSREGTADIVVRDPAVTEMLKYKPMFLTECDWKVINDKYPGIKRAPHTCRPNVLPKVLVPSHAFVQMKGRDEAVRLCYMDPSKYFDDLMCVVPHGREYPEVPFDEVRYCGSGTVPSEVLGGFCSKVVANTKYITQEECKNHCMKSCPLQYPFKPIRHCLRDNYPRCRPASACLQKKLSP